MRALVILGVAAALVGLAGCGQGGDPADAGAPEQTRSTKVPPEVTPTPSSTEPQDPPPGEPKPAAPTAPVSLSPTGPVVPAGVKLVPAAQVDASALPEYYDHRGQVWVYDDGYSLQTFAAATSGCGGVEARVATESATEVRMFLRAVPQPQGGPPDGTACTAVMTPRPATVALDAPLGDRKIYLAGGR